MQGEGGEERRERMNLSFKATLVNSGKDRNLIELPDKVKVPTEFDKKTMKKVSKRWIQLEYFSDGMKEMSRFSI